MLAPPTARLSPSSKSICEFYFTELQKQLWQCKKGLKNKAKSGGWTNLLSHLQTCVGGDYEATFLDYKKQALPVTSGFYTRVSDHEKEMHHWINFVVMKNLPMSFVDCPHSCSICKLKPISGRTLRCHIIALRNILKDTLQNELPPSLLLYLMAGLKVPSITLELRQHI